ncbi:Hsp70 family chaperone [Colletotrichum sp. SAR11_240]|nr:Hsp70 family chaperone [Colletotrichum sp. SAR11_240]
MMDIDDMRLRVAITVPAIWPEYARSLMREAAEIAGITNERDIGETTLILVAEPEAAALATLFEHNSYLIKDVISYTVESEKPFKLNECVVGAGAFQIDESFKTHLQGTAKKIELLSNLEYNQFFYREWEQGAKRSFSNAEEPKFFHLRMPSKALGRMNRLRNRESLEINREEMKGFFNKSYTGIRKLISSQYDQVEKKTGKPPKENISSQNTLSPKQRKALHALPSVISRKSRYHYGIVVKVPVDDINPEDGDQSFKDPEGVKRVNRMKWYLNKGEKVDETSHTRVPYHKLMRAPLPPRCTFKIMYSSEDVAPKRPSPEVSELCIIECDWDKPFEKWKPVGNPSLGWRKHDDLELTMGLKGEPIWMIRVGSKSVEHDFEVKYM